MDLKRSVFILTAAPPSQNTPVTSRSISGQFWRFCGNLLTLWFLPSFFGRYLASGAKIRYVLIIILTEEDREDSGLNVNNRTSGANKTNVLC